jgi:hypothetical protein
MYVFGTFVTDQVAVWSCILFCWSGFVQSHAGAVTMVMEYNLKSGIIIPPAFLLLLTIAFAIWGLLCLHMNFRTDFSISMKNYIGFFWGWIALNL